MVSSSEEIAARGTILLYVADLAAERRRLAGDGIELGDDIPGDYSTLALAQVRDPDGNRVTLASPPSRTFPHAWRPFRVIQSYLELATAKPASARLH